jgi:hypothetical protein
MSISRAVSTIALGLAVSGCGGASPAAPAPSTPATDSLSSVTNMVPAPGTPLQAGQTVTFSGTPGYVLASADFGTVVMVIEDQNDRVLPMSSTLSMTVVGRGSGDVTISQTVTLPADGITSVQVFFVLAPAGATSTKASVRLEYPVR